MSPCGRFFSPSSSNVWIGLANQAVLLTIPHCIARHVKGPDKEPRLSLKDQGMPGCWRYKSRSHDAVYEGAMFQLHVTYKLANWTEKNTRQRLWVSVLQKQMKDALIRG